MLASFRMTDLAIALLVSFRMTDLAIALLVSFRMTAAMAAGVSNRVWSVEELIGTALS